MWLGIDFGTTNSAISFSDGKRVHTFRVDEKLPNLLPSLIYITKNYEEYVGTTARNWYLEKNTDRPSLFKAVEVGVIKLGVGTTEDYEEISQAVIAMIDVLAPGRLIRSIKTGLRTIEYEGSIVFGRFMRVEQLISILFKRLIEIVEPLVGEPITQVVMGRPVKFSDNPAIDKHAEDKIIEAAQLAGIQEVVFLPEPIAAAYAYHRDFTRPTNTFIFDFGGGTLDLTVAQLGGAEPKILATEGVLIGGDDIDKRLFELLMPIFGKGTKLTIDRMDGSVVERPLPEHIWDALGDWQTIEEMKRTDTVGFIEEASRPGNSTNPQAMKALHELISRNLYFSLLQQVERAKVELSNSAETNLKFKAQTIDIDINITRHQFRRLINNEIFAIDRAINRVIANSGLDFDDIEYVVPTGGSSQIPIFQHMLGDKFWAAEFATKAERNMTGVVQGLGIYGNDLDAEDDAASARVRARLFDDIQAAPAVVPDQAGRDRSAPIEFSHAIVGVTLQGKLVILPYRSGKLIENQYVRLRTGMFISKAGTILVGSTHGKFIAPELNDLYNMMNTPALTPHQYKIDPEIGESFIFVDKWQFTEKRPLAILVTRWGNTRKFQRRLINTPLREDRVWKLHVREKVDAPSTLVNATKADVILLMTESGRCARMHVKDISVRGSRGLRLKTTETVHAVTLSGNQKALIILPNGKAERIYPNDIPFVNKKIGIQGLRLFKNIHIVKMLPITEQETARALTNKGRLVDLDLVDVKFMSGQHDTVNLEREETIVNCWYR